jgi:hypothetical protein
VILDDEILLVWFALAAVSVVYVTWDSFVRRNPEITVMKWGWVLITLYMGPIALALYVLTDKEPRPGEHEEFIKPLWKQGSARRSTASPVTPPGSSPPPLSWRPSGCRCGST